ncbi:MULTISPECIES: hypothetical protein [Pantoea]|uniref:Uncharacterized protein n=1 Tax=Candidatus Pantoea floridensis TaxID=1938870 RepID=A0A286DQC6_9GAMM|nr:hypothetical protein [Pantoea floridensis]PIF14898.1 hypothetical protein BX596_3999 [Enterobacteriaceae bacterium JKS000233]SOD60892.1 hypothetical protein SAMN06273570_4895 [Pantoea floridensis]
MKTKEIHTMIKWSLALISSPICASFLSLSSIWLYLMRLGRQDLFLEFVNLKDIFGALSIFTILSAISFGFVFYIQTFLITSIFAFTSNQAVEEKNRKGYIKLNFISSFAAVFIFYLYVYINEKLKVNINPGWVILLNCLICNLLSFVALKNNVKNENECNEKKYCFSRLFIKITIPSLIGFSSFLLVFPLSLIFKAIEFPEGTDNLKELIILIPLSLLVTFITIIPVCIVFSDDIKTSMFRKIITAVGVAFSLLVTTSLFIPGIPLLILNSTLQISGAIDYRPYHFSVPVKNYPSERLSAQNWDMKKSDDSNFLLFKGATFLSLGTIKLICPVQVVATYKNSMKSRLLSDKYDSALLDTLKSQAAECLVFRKDELSQWVINQSTLPAEKTHTP